MINKESTNKKKKPTETTTVKVQENLQIIDKASGKVIIRKRG